MRVILRIIPSQPNRNSFKIHKLRPEGMSPKAQDKDGSTFSATLNSKPETNFLGNMHPFIIVSVEQRAEKSQGQAARPLLDLLAYANTFALDLFTPTFGNN